MGWQIISMKNALRMYVQSGSRLVEGPLFEVDAGFFHRFMMEISGIPFMILAGKRFLLQSFASTCFSLLHIRATYPVKGSGNLKAADINNDGGVTAGDKRKRSSREPARENI